MASALPQDNLGIA